MFAGRLVMPILPKLTAFGSLMPQLIHVGSLEIPYRDFAVMKFIDNSIAIAISRVPSKFANKNLLHLAPHSLPIKSLLFVCTCPYILYLAPSIDPKHVISGPISLPLLGVNIASSTSNPASSNSLYLISNLLLYVK